MMFMTLLHGLLATRWLFFRPASSPLFLPAVLLSAKSKTNVSGIAALHVYLSDVYQSNVCDH
jgi:cytochrome c biogenesis protein CcdA